MQQLVLGVVKVHVNEPTVLVKRHSSLLTPVPSNVILAELIPFPDLGSVSEPFIVTV